MYQEKRKFYRIFNEQKGFTLIEMAIVLIIIGIIIGAVVKGKDIIRSGEQKKLYSTFLNAWEVSYSSYYDRTGWILGDDTSNDNASRDGQCGVVGGSGRDPASEANLNAQLTAIGLERPSEGPTGATNVRTYTDSNGNFATITINFLWDTNYGNYISMAAIPNELGMAWDRIVDGQMDGTAGNFLYIPTSAAMSATNAWPSAAVAPVGASVAILKQQF